MTGRFWTFQNPVQVVGGLGSLERLGEWLPAQGTILLMTTPGATRRGLTARLTGLVGAGRTLLHDQVTPNPELDDLDEILPRLRRTLPVGILAVGGGSVMDAAKVLATILPTGMERPLAACFREGATIPSGAALPVVAVPTTAGTGAEVTPFATVWDQASHCKYSLTGPHVYPKVALLDPELTFGLPEQETLNTGLDALSHALESLWNCNRTEVTAALAIRALDLGLSALSDLLADPENQGQRAAMQQAAMLAGLAISQTRTALAHAISYPFTSRFGVPHGLACSFTLPTLADAYLATGLAPAERDLVIRARDYLASLELGAAMRRYLNGADLSLTWKEMNHPERAGNISFPVPPDQVRRLVERSL